jgi:hypothetical protein
MVAGAEEHVMVRAGVDDSGVGRAKVALGAVARRCLGVEAWKFFVRASTRRD